VLSAGAYGTPAALLRSGIGQPDRLRGLGIEPVHAVAGVGQSMQDHPAFSLSVRGSAALVEQLRDWRATRWLPDEQALGKARSRDCREAFDLHVYTYAPRALDAEAWNLQLVTANVAPQSVGSVTLRSRAPDTPPVIDHGFLSDPDGLDLAVLQDGVELLREIVNTPPLSDLVESADSELQALPSGTDLRMLLGRRVGIYYHPSCTARMGPSSDPQAVVDATSRVHGLEGLYICDASIYPRLMRANTNLPSAMLAEHLGTVIARSDGGPVQDSPRTSGHLR
jgi:choline dehydrogenase